MGAIFPQRPYSHMSMMELILKLGPFYPKVQMVIHQKIESINKYIGLARSILEKKLRLVQQILKYIM